MAGSLRKVILCSFKTRPTRSSIIVRNRQTSTAARVPQDLNQENYIRKKFAALMQWYEEVTGMDEVRLAQHRVLDAEEKFVAAQERRREVNKEVSAVQAKLKELYGELESTSRGEDRYVQLITQEHRVLKDERRLTEEFSRCEREERDGFTTLSTAVKDSHEKERAQAEKTKYWSIIGSIVGTVIGIFGSSINNEIKMKQLRRLVQDSLVNKSNNETTIVPEALSKHERELSLLIQEIKNVTTQPSEDIIGHLQELIHNLDNKTLENGDVSVATMLKTQEENNSKNFDELKSLMKSHFLVPEVNGDHIVVMPVGLEERLQNQYKQTQQILIITAVIAVTLPIIFKYVGFS